MKRFAQLAIALVALLFALAACDKQEASDEEAADEEAAAEEAEGDEGEEDEELEMVEVSDDGEVFDPPVEKEQIPEGAWFCDMGTVHYAQMEEGDGTCPECNMKLKQKGGGEDEGEEHADHDHDDEDHDHDDEGHDH
ncbi:MAG: hypothetical protein ACOCV2_00545 [Persicimonas sp.]